MADSQITVYTTTSCPYCVQVKRLLDSRGLQYEEIDLARDPEGRMELVKLTGMMTFPQVIVGGQLVGGFTETRAAAQSGQLDALLAS